MHETNLMNLKKTDFSDRAQKGLNIKENTDQLHFVKIKSREYH